MDGYGASSHAPSKLRRQDSFIMENAFSAAMVHGNDITSSLSATNWMQTETPTYIHASIGP